MIRNSAPALKGTEEYLGINFIDGDDVIFDKPIQANALPVYETVDYSSIQAGAEFLKASFNYIYHITFKVYPRKN